MPASASMTNGAVRFIGSVFGLHKPDQPERVDRVHRRFGDLGHQCHVLTCRETRDQIVELEHEADMLPAKAGDLAVILHGEVVIEEVDGARAYVAPL